VDSWDLDAQVVRGEGGCVCGAGFFGEGMFAAVESEDADGAVDLCAAEGGGLGFS